MSDVPDPAKQKRPGMSGLLDTVKEETIMLERACAGYSTMSACLRQAVHGVGNGERKRGIPMLTYSGSAEGGKSTEVVVDLQKVHPSALGPVLVPICQIHLTEMWESANRMKLAVDEMLTQIIEVMPNREAPNKNQEHHEGTNPV